MDLGGVDREGGAAWPSGVRRLSELHPADAGDLGQEALDLAELADAGLPIAHGWLVRLSDEPAARLQTVVGRALAEGRCARVRPLFPQRAAAQRFERRVGTVRDIQGEDEAVARVMSLLDAVAVPEVTAALGGSSAPVQVRVVACDPEPAGRAASTDPVHGDPDEVSVWSHGEPAARWRIDRRTMRATVAGTELAAADVTALADLVDRAQLVLGRPVEIEWCARGGQFSIVGVRPLALRPTFGRGQWRLVALASADEGTVAPLSIDTLDRALQGEGDTDEPARVRRIYARPYRRMDASGPPVRTGNQPASTARASAHAARVASDVATPLSAARRFDRALAERLAELDAVDPSELDDRALMAAFRRSQRLAADALVLLDRGREASLAVISGIEAAVGPLPRESYPALVAPKRTRARRRAHERMRRLARQLQDEPGPRDALPSALRRRWDQTRKELADVRPLGLDLRADAYGASDETLRRALEQIVDVDDDAVERARRDAVRRVRATARARPLGRSREAIVAPLTVLAGRVAQAKGNVGEGLASALLRLRRCACEAGRRLVDRGVVDSTHDAMYMHLTEIEEALAGEPGAYAARVRLRREDDARWARFDAPRRIEGRVERPLP